MILIGDTHHGTLIARAAKVGFDPEVDSVFSRCTSDGQLLGGFIMTGYTGSIMWNHMAGLGPWCSPQLMWIIFDYQFNQLNLTKVMATVASTNHRAMNLVMRAGFEPEYTIKGGVPDGNMHLLSMVRAKCKWLRLRDRFMRLNGGHRGEDVHVHA